MNVKHTNNSKFDRSELEADQFSEISLTFQALFSSRMRLHGNFSVDSPLCTVHLKAGDECESRRLKLAGNGAIDIEIERRRRRRDAAIQRHHWLNTHGVIGPDKLPANSNVAAPNPSSWEFGTHPTWWIVEIDSNNIEIDFSLKNIP